MYIFIFLFKLCYKWLVYAVGKQYGINAFVFKHIDVLALLNLVCDIKYSVFMFFFIFFKAFRKSEIFAFQILEQNIVRHFFTEFLIFKAAEFDERTDIIPVFFISFLICFTHSG